MDWTTIVCAFIAAGGLTAICLLVEKKSGASIDNALKLCQESMARTEVLADKYLQLANEYQDQAERASQRADAKEVELIIITAWTNRETGHKVKVDDVSAMTGDEIVVIRKLFAKLAHGNSKLLMTDVPLRHVADICIIGHRLDIDNVGRRDCDRKTASTALQSDCGKIL